MNAYIMAAGNGMRLRPLTDNFQKCLLPVNGKPILRYWLDSIFESQKFENVFVNIHHCARDVKKWIIEYFEETNRLVIIIDETLALLGTAKTLYNFADKTKDFMVVYADTYSDQAFNNLKDIVDLWYSRKKDIIAGLLVFPSPGDNSGASVQTDCVGNIISFKEKEGNENIIWAGIIFAKKDFFLYLRDSDKDLARDVLPRICGKMKIISQIEAYDIGRGISCYEKFSKSNIIK